jgi:hypothetical protein
LHIIRGLGANFLDNLAVWTILAAEINPQVYFYRKFTTNVVNWQDQRFKAPCPAPHPSTPAPPVKAAPPRSLAAGAMIGDV